MYKRPELDLRPSYQLTLLAFIAGALVFLLRPATENVILHTILDTSIVLMTTMLAVMFWDKGRWVNEPFFALLAVCFGTVAIFELIHTLVALDALTPWLLRLRGRIWAPTTFLLPIALLVVRLLPQLSRSAMGGILAVVAAILFLGYGPASTAIPALFGMPRPVLVLVPLLWLAVGALYWRHRGHDDTSHALALASGVVAMATLASAYSQTTNDGPALTGHWGRLVGDIFLLLSLIQMGASDMARRIRAERQLLDVNQQLENWVRERTVALEQTNLSLTAENQSRREAERKLNIQLDRLNLLNHITRAISDRQDMSSVFQVVVQSLEDQLPLDFACFCQYDQNKTLTVSNFGLRSYSAARAAAVMEPDQIPIDTNGVARALKGNLVYEPDISGTPYYFLGMLARMGMRSVVLAPVTVEGAAFGLLVAARRNDGAFMSGDCEFLKQLSDHVGVAANQSHLYQTVRTAYDDLRQSQNAMMQQERLRALGQMASGIAHDINNSLSPMSLHTDALLETETDLPPRLVNYLKTVRRVSDDISQTIRKMREFYRARDTNASMAAVDLNQIITQVLDLTRARWQAMPLEHGAAIEVRLDLANDPPAIPGVANELRDMLTNLIFNAVDAMPSGGVLTIRSRQLDMPPTAPGGLAGHYFVLEVSDTGLGMDEETRRRCLEPFFTTKGERGTGLGLAMVLGTAKRHSADIEIDSVPEEGTTFRLRFPVGPIPAQDSPNKPVARTPMQPLKLLLVDDDPFVLDSLQAVLGASGHAISAAADGQTALRLFHDAIAADTPFDAVITDLGMPYMDGRQVARAIKQASASTPVILLTGWGQRLEGGLADPAQVDQVLSKPPKLSEIQEALRACTSRAPALSGQV